MPTLKINNSEIIEMLGQESPEFPLYASFIINQANRTAQATRPKIVGQMSELVPQFREEMDDKSYESWKQWYLNKYPNAIDIATDKTYNKILQFQEVIKDIDEEMVREWIEDLVLLKSYIGLSFQELIITKIAEIENTSYKFSSSEDESKGIDGYIDNKPVSIKPTTYKTKEMNVENIDVHIIYYDKKNDKIIVEYNF